MSRPAQLAGAVLGIVAQLSSFSGAMAADRPQLKPGLWEMALTVAGSRRPPRTYRLCVDAKTLSVFDRLAQSGPSQACSRNTVRTEGSRVIADAVCKVETSQVTTHTEITYQSETAFRSEIHAHYEPAFFGTTDSNSVRTAKWIGACSPDMHPGDVTTEAGIKLNLNDFH
jgi:hypothetical protein